MMPFLGMLIIRESDGSLNFSVYRKPTHTENYLEFDSTNPLNHKKTVVRSLVDRSLKNFSNQDLLQYEYNVFESTPWKTGFPKVT